MDSIENIIIGGGVVGLALARHLALLGREVALLEAEAQCGQGTSSRNSGVIHAGLYYRPGSLKASIAVRGRDLLYEFARTHNVPHARCGKLVVAHHNDDVPRLQALIERGQQNGLTDLTWLSAAEAQAHEPQLKCVGAIYSPSSGIIDQHEYMWALEAVATDHGALIATHSPVVGISKNAHGFVVEIGGASPSFLAAKNIINAAGLGAQRVASLVAEMKAEHIPPLLLNKGHYFTCSAPAPFTHLIYPSPPTAGSGQGHGIHYLRDLAGQMRFGPDAHWVEKIDYAVPENLAESFYQAVEKYWPEVRSHNLRPDYAGIRPRLSRTGSSEGDFMLQSSAQHGVVGLINLFGIESPGLTVSLALAEKVAELL